ncbi:MAG: hypothetical protein KGZ74_09270 [Chitinophagaceae bacterium]|nr:hypothetical protein [Chitinophagaceae bacterium]
MSLLFPEDYEYLISTGLKFIEDEGNRFLVLQNFPVPEGMYVAPGNIPISQVEVLVIIPSNYNTSGTDMLWTHPAITRSDQGAMPNVNGYGAGDNRTFMSKEFCRWSRHYDATSWKPKVDTIVKILGRIEWALQNPGT